MGTKKDNPLSKKLHETEKQLTKEFIKWRFKRTGQQPPDSETLDKGSEKIVEEAHRVVKKGGRNFVDELKKAKDEFLKAYRDDDED